MALLFTDDDENLQKINIDDLYEKHQQRDLKQIGIFNKILNRIHKRITFTGKNKRNEQHIFFNVHEYIFGEPNYDNGECVAYLVTKLEDNGFYVKYMHPNTLYISWENWIPTYARNEYKKRTGIEVDEHGNLIENIESFKVRLHNCKSKQNIKKSRSLFLDFSNKTDNFPLQLFSS
jgi:hypothetical protein